MVKFCELLISHGMTLGLMLYMNDVRTSLVRLLHVNYYFFTQNFSGYAQNSMLWGGGGGGGVAVCCLLGAAHTAPDPWLWPLMDWILENLPSGSFCRWSHPI